MAQKKFDYHSAQAELEAILEHLQAGDIDVDQAIAQYERGMQLVKELEAYLKTAENKVTQLKAKLQA